MKPWLKRLVWVAIAAAVILLLVRAFRQAPVLVDIATVQRGPLLVTVDDDGRTRVRERYTISAPIQGRLLRTPLRAGDDVDATETLVAEFVPVAPDLLDARHRAEAEARELRADAAVSETEARKEQAVADLEFAQRELERARELVAKGIDPEESLDRAERDERRASQGLRAAEFGVQVAHYELEVARASLLETGSPVVEGGDGAAVVRDAADGRLGLRSPIDGKVLRVFEESARTLSAGAPILEIGSTDALEVVADYLSQDAVRVRPGMDVLVEGWGGELSPGSERVLHGRVRVVEPSGFTKVSALGVEEQRVNIIVDPVGDAAEWARLGDGYRVELRIVLWEDDDVLTVPAGALFREGDSWSVLLIENGVDGVALPRMIEIGHRTGLEAQVVDGLQEGQVVILYPSELIGEGTRVETR